MKFSHIGDCHLGGWRQPELQQANFESFQKAINISIKEKVEFILIAGDLFDSAYPPIEILKSAFEEFRKIKEAKIPVFLIAGSHDYSVSGKTFLDVLEKAGFCKNVFQYEERAGKRVLQPTIYNNVAIYGFPGRKSGMEVDDISEISINPSPGLFQILMLHTTIRDAIGNAPVKAVDESKLPNVDYLALGHLHINYSKKNRVYCGPTFPNNISELEELRGGSFYIYDNGNISRRELKVRDILPIHLEITNALTATDDLLSLLKKEDVKDKIIVIRLSGILEKGRTTDIDFVKVENSLKKRGALVLVKSTTKLSNIEQDVEIESLSSEDVENKILGEFEKKNPSKFNSLIPSLIRSLQITKLEGETNSSFQSRLLSETDRIIK